LALKLLSASSHCECNHEKQETKSEDEDNMRMSQ
jgi:hypothetical protein